ncbi:MAG TPA: lysylphosphatidylglycerol synthase domain-containing protein [Herbaspirillum sp.]
MTRAAWIALSVGLALFVALLAWQGIGSIAATLSVAGWGLLLVAAFHLVPLLLDALAINVLLPHRSDTNTNTLGASLLARWSGESVNSLMPAGQLGGPVLMVRHLSQRDISKASAASVITVSTTLQSLAQVVFALLGIAVFAWYRTDPAAAVATTTAVATDMATTALVPAHARIIHGSAANLSMPLIAITLFFAALLYGFYVAQKRGLFGGVMRLVARFGARMRKPADWSAWFDHADAIDAAVRALYLERRKTAWSFLLSLAGWIVGTGEVWLGLKLIGHPVGWVDALLLESLGQAIRGAAFMVPGSLGVQEGGYLLLAPLVGLPPDAALALSLIKRSREILLGLPGLVYLQFSERNWRRRSRAAALQAAID